MRYLIFIVICFCFFCGGLIIESGVFQNLPQIERRCIILQQAAAVELQNPASVNEPDKITDNLESSEPRFTPAPPDFSAVGGPTKTIVIGAKDPKTEDHETGFKFQLELSSIGASIKKATFTSGPYNGRPSGFNDRNPKDPQPLVILSPVKTFDGRELLSMANKGLVLVKQNRQLALDKLSWQSVGVETSSDGSEKATFEAVIKDENDGKILKLTTTYMVSISSYLAECKITIENLADDEQQVRFGLRGPLGLEKEDFRSDLRKVVGAFLTSDGQVVSSRHNIHSQLFSRQSGLKKETIAYEKAVRSGDKAQIAAAKENLRIGSNLADRYRQSNFLWAAVTNKYFAAILVPQPDEGKDYCDWIAGKTAWYVNPDGDQRGNTGDETVGLDLQIAPVTLAKTGQADASKTYSFQLYIGPKDRDLFNKNPLYKKLGFIQAIDFMACCCCPNSIIRPLAFGILAIMKWMYGFIGNYGVVIIILVFLMRLILHPVTKKSQVSMSKMSKLAPRTEEIRKKYANNKAEMNKQMMALYKEHGASPIMGMLPMFVQMPIWFALYSAVNTSIDLRGAAFLPFWITDLSVPDAALKFATITIPLLGWKINSLNLLPILMGVAFYLQQKLTPTQPTASTSPQMAQQQKMMMIMMPVLFPLMLYNLPSGVNLYIMTSTFAGVIESHVIKKHIRKKDEEDSQGLVATTSKTGGKVKKKKPKPFFKI
jgi:YidC/Oxa1 family membrane protein insertase